VIQAAKRVAWLTKRHTNLANLAVAARADAPTLYSSPNSDANEDLIGRPVSPVSRFPYRIQIERLSQT